VAPGRILIPLCVQDGAEYWWHGRPCRCVPSQCLPTMAIEKRLVAVPDVGTMCFPVILTRSEAKRKNLRTCLSARPVLRFFTPPSSGFRMTDSTGRSTRQSLISGILDIMTAEWNKILPPPLHCVQGRGQDDIRAMRHRHGSRPRPLPVEAEEAHRQEGCDHYPRAEDCQLRREVPDGASFQGNAAHGLQHG